MNDQISYEQIRNTSPGGGRRSRPFRRLTAWQGILFFAVVIAVLLFFGGTLYEQTGNYTFETLAEQAWILIAAWFFVRIMRADRREVFPFRKPSKLAVGGVLVLLLVSFLAARIYSMFLLYLAPDLIKQMSEEMNSLLQTSSLPVELLTACVLPAVCEEAMHRGVILNSLHNTFSDRRLCVLFGGLLFGLFHIYPIRMFMPALIGFFMSWIVLISDNLFYSFLLHFGYNGILVLLSRVSENAGTDPEILDEITISAPMAGMSLIVLGILIPFLTYLGTWMIRRAVSPRIPEFLPKEHAARIIWSIFLPTVAIFVVGICLIFKGISG